MYRILAVDYANLLYRSWWSAKGALGENRQKQNISPIAIFRFFQSIYVSMRELRANNLILAGESFVTLNRTKIDPLYKNGRKKPEESEWKIFNKVLAKMLEVLGLPIVYYAGMEGDDIIAAFTRYTSWDRIYIMSLDKDLRQLIRKNHVSIVLPDISRTSYTATHFKEEYGFDPSRFYIYKALVGDKSDAIPGVDGIGPVMGKLICAEENVGEALNNALMGFPEKHLAFNNALRLVRLNYDTPEKTYRQYYDWTPATTRQIRLAKSIAVKAFGEHLIDGIINEVRKLMTLNYPRSKIVAIDYDGTLARDSWPGVGKKNDAIFEAALAEQAKGAKLVLWTCREGQELLDAINLCKQNGLEFAAVNANLPEVLEWLGGLNDTRKIFADEYWDDRAVPVVCDKNDRYLLKRD